MQSIPAFDFLLAFISSRFLSHLIPLNIFDEMASEQKYVLITGYVSDSIIDSRLCLI